MLFTDDRIMGNSPKTLDLTRGYYRRQYSGFVRGRRINQLSLQAEAWFWRLHSAADDFGNLEGEPTLVFAATVGRRKNVTLEDVTAFVREMLSSELVRDYEAEGDRYLHVVEFAERQPAGKNGRRVRRCPASPWDSPEPLSGDSGRIPVNPELSGCQNKHEHKHYQNPPTASPSEGCTEPANTRTSEPPLLVFPCVRGRKSQGTEWPLTEAYHRELAETFAGVNVLAEAKKALAWSRANPSKRKTFDGMPEFLRRWMSRNQNRAGDGPQNGNGRLSASEERAQATAAAAIADLAERNGK